jgi:hypothetical protein
MAIPGIALLINILAIAQPTQPPVPQEATPQPSAVPGAPRPSTSSNPWVTLPQMSVDRCIADDVGTGPDPKTAGPVRVNVDPKSGAAGNTICPPQQPSANTTPPGTTEPPQ